MPIPDLEKQAAESKLKAYCEKKVPPQYRDQLRLVLETKNMSIVILEERPYFQDPSKWISSPVAKFTYRKKDRLWHLLWSDRNSKWHHFNPPVTAKKFEDLLEVVERDETCIFWG